MKYGHQTPWLEKAIGGIGQSVGWPSIWLRHWANRNEHRFLGICKGTSDEFLFLPKTIILFRIKISDVIRLIHILACEQNKPGRYLRRQVGNPIQPGSREEHPQV